MGNAISLQKERTAFMIFDSETKKYYDKHLRHDVRHVYPGMKKEDLDET